MKLQFEEERATYRSAEVSAALEADRRSLGERSAELLTLKTQSQSLPIELEAAKAAEAEAKTQVARHQEGASMRLRFHRLQRHSLVPQRLHRCSVLAASTERMQVLHPHSLPSSQSTGGERMKSNFSCRN